MPDLLINILQYGVQTGYTGPLTSHIVSRNLRSALLDPQVIDKKLQLDLSTGRVISTSLDPSVPYISSPLGLVPKHDGGLRRIHHLSYPQGLSVNDHITKEAAHLTYTTLQEIINLIIKAGRHCIIIKKDIKDAFRGIPIATHHQWLLGFFWAGTYYKKTCLPFGLSTAPFIFNLFAEAFHWMLESYLGWTNLRHYLDDFIHVVSANSLSSLDNIHQGYNNLTDCLGIPRNESKDAEGTIVSVLGIELDTNLFTARLPEKKLHRAIEATKAALIQQSLTLREAQSLTGFLSFCARAVRLGWVFMRSLWDFIASYPSQSSSYTKRRMSSAVQKDLTWWNTLLPTYNGVLFFDESKRPTIQLYTDASLQGLEGFFYYGVCPWPEAMIPQTNAFTASTLGDSHINVYEVQAILLAFQTWSHQWKNHQVSVVTDNTTAYEGLKKHTLRGSANTPLREILLLAAKQDIVIVPCWISSGQNGLADALSRGDKQTIANLCPYWQNQSSTLHLQLHS